MIILDLLGIMVIFLLILIAIAIIIFEVGIPLMLHGMKKKVDKFIAESTSEENKQKLRELVEKLDEKSSDIE